MYYILLSAVDDMALSKWSTESILSQPNRFMEWLTRLSSPLEDRTGTLLSLQLSSLAILPQCELIQDLHAVD
jgi:hypothetical protein